MLKAIPTGIQCTLACFIILLVQHDSYSQTISGKIRDEQTKEAVPYANIYFNNSYYGTISDADGNFELDISQNPGQDIVVSCMGYESQLIADYVPGNYYVIYLKLKLNSIGEVAIIIGGMPREKMIEIFEREFLGETKNTKKCTIENIDDLGLRYNNSSGTLLAYSPKPLIISNKELGYRITYFLEEFKWEKDRMVYRGYSIFAEDTTLSVEEIRHVEKKRKQTFLGSRMHFFRVLWNNAIHNSEFKVFFSKEAEINVIFHKNKLHLTQNESEHNEMSEINLLNSVMIENVHVKNLYYPETLIITYYKHNKSYLSFHKNTSIQFTKSGFFNPVNIYWEGDMANKRIGDQLPYEYSLPIKSIQE